MTANNQDFTLAAECPANLRPVIGVGSTALLGSVVFLLIGENYRGSGDAVIACCATEADAEKIKTRGETTKNEHGRLRYGFDELAIYPWSVGEVAYCVERVSLQPNDQGQTRSAQNTNHE